MGQQKGFKHSEETKKRISETVKQNLPKFAFKKGCSPPPHAFKKGHVPWVKGKKFPEMAAKRMGVGNPNWKGGIKEEFGYIYLYKPDHPHTRHKYVKRCVLVMEENIGRYLIGNEIVHHINNDRKDDRIENLYLCKDKSEHMKIHRNNLNPHTNGTTFQK